jgi:hypothetical protein
MRFLSGSFVLLLVLVTGCGGGVGGGSEAPAEPSSSATDDQVSIDEESSVVIDIIANDQRVDGNTVALASNPGNGTAELSDTNIEYTPEADFWGTDSFRYSVTGDDGAQLSATVNITVIDINDAPVVTADRFDIIEDNPLLLSLGANDVDIDGVISSVEITGSFPGKITGSGVELVYTPPLDFTGEVTFQYQAVDDDGALSNTANVIISVASVVITAIEVVQLQIPASSYTSVNDSELGAAVLSSALQELTVPPNIVSVLLTLSGSDANIDANGLFISDLIPPSGPFPVFQRFVNFCFEGNCSSLVPRSPAFVAESGDWTFQLGTLAGTLDDIDLAGLTLTAIFRTGPTPDTSEAGSTSVNVKPFLTADSIGVAELQPALARLAAIGAANQIEYVIEPVTVIEESEFTSVSVSFLDPETIALVSRGDAVSVNLFFLEDFSGGARVAGIAGGVPGSFGSLNGNNGILINAGTLLADGSETSIQDTAEIMFHETGHQLGLYHTTEARFSFVDVIDDTPFCEAAVHDKNNDGVANADECPDAINPMFWFNSVLIEPGVLTAHQKHVVFYSPIAAPGGL